MFRLNKQWVTKFDVLIVMTIEVIIFGVMTLCSDVVGYRCFCGGGGPCNLQLQDGILGCDVMQ
jgi:hypothetical protein